MCAATLRSPLVGQTFARPATPVARPKAAATVEGCYEVLDACVVGGVYDFTDGKYADSRNDRRGYLDAQRRQAEYLLDQVRCAAGSRLLDVGCGYGRILRQAAERGATATGITISTAQEAAGRASGLDVRTVNYRDLFRNFGEDWTGRFNCVVANGSLEHFAHPADALAGRTDDVYSEMFDIFRRLLGSGGRTVTTAIHLADAHSVDLAEYAAGAPTPKRGSFAYHYKSLIAAFGGWYPAAGQLERCAAGRFELVAEEDGTNDYHLTSEYWLGRLRWSLANPRVWAALGKKWLANPRATRTMIRCLLIDQSWNWQFHAPAPMRLYRQTWQAV